MHMQRFFWQNRGHIYFKGRKIVLWDRLYWITHYFLINIPFRFYYSKFVVHKWENVPLDKPVIFAITHRNAFMDSLAFVATKNTQVFQLARGDAFSTPFLSNLFYFFHMLPIWREQDKGGNRNISNDETFDACYELLSKNQMLGIYPEGDCINVNTVRPLKKGICRIAFGAMEKYNWIPDVQIVPVGVNYSDAEKFREWKMIHFGEPISVKAYKDLYLQNSNQATAELKDVIEAGMREVGQHIPPSHYVADIDQLMTIAGRQNILDRREEYDPVSKFYEQKKIIAGLEKLRTDNHEEMSELVKQLHKYQKLMQQFNFRENTFDKYRQNGLVIILMLLYFVVMLPVYLFGLAVNYLPFTLIRIQVEKRVKRKIFYSSLKYAAGIILYPLWYLILFITIWIITGSIVSGILFLLSFPFAGIIAFHYWYDLQKWWSVIRFKYIRKRGDAMFAQMTAMRQQIINKVNAVSA